MPSLMTTPSTNPNFASPLSLANPVNPAPVSIDAADSNVGLTLTPRKDVDSAAFGSAAMKSMFGVSSEDLKKKEQEIEKRKAAQKAAPAPAPSASSAPGESAGFAFGKKEPAKKVSAAPKRRHSFVRAERAGGSSGVGKS